MMTAMIRYSATTVAYVADYDTPCRVDMGNVGSRTKVVDHDQSSTHDKHYALLCGYIR